MRQSAFLVLMVLFAITSSEATSLDKIGLRNAPAAHTMQMTVPPKNQRFACVQPPSSCSSNNDCTCSGCCATLGEGGRQLCQPTLEPEPNAAFDYGVANL